MNDDSFSKLNEHSNMITDKALQKEFLLEELKKTEKNSKKYSPLHDQNKFSNPATRSSQKQFIVDPNSHIPHDINDSKARREDQKSKIRRKLGGIVTPPNDSSAPPKYDRSAADREPSTPSACTKVFNALSGIPEFHHAMVKVLGGISNTDQELIRARNE
jgi:hypothetical protein